MGVLSQFRTYSGVLAGFPDRAMTQRRIEYLLDEGKGLAVTGSSPYLIPPNLVTRDVVRRGETRVEERLPPVACLARFDSGELATDSDPYSSLVVAWFQDAFGLPNEGVLEEIRRIDWERHAAAWCW
jgi:hypothetical protein